MTHLGCESPHKGKIYKVWTYQYWVDMSNKHKIIVSSMTMMWKHMKGTHALKAWLKVRKEFVKTSQENIFHICLVSNWILRGGVAT